MRSRQRASCTARQGYEVPIYSLEEILAATIRVGEWQIPRH